MTEKASSRIAARRAAVKREVLDAAWVLMEEQGVAAVSAREVARAVGLRQQSLTYYFPTKQDLLDALFADGFNDLQAVLDAVPEATDPIESVAAVSEAVARYCGDHPARYHLMFQRTVPGFEPSAASHQVALGCLDVLVTRLRDAGVTDRKDVALVRGLISGLAAEQIANRPGKRDYIGQVGRGVRALLATTAPASGA